MTTSEASPREAAATATAAAVEWLARQLHDGPRPSGQLHHDARAAGLSRYQLYGASEALAVQRLNRGRHSTWALPQHFVPEPAEKRCDVCGEIRASEDFLRPATRGRTRGRRVRPACSKCTDARSRRTDKRRPEASPALVEAQEDRVASGAPDPAPAVALRHELVTARRSGETFTAAWGVAMATALEAAEPRERDDWRDVLLETHGAWRAGYDRHEALDHHQALAMLAAAA